MDNAVYYGRVKSSGQFAASRRYAAYYLGDIGSLVAWITGVHTLRREGQKEVFTDEVAPGREPW